MAGVKVATRYARSFLGLVSEKGQLEEAYADMLLIQQTTSSNRELELMLKSPVVNTDKKISILKSIFGERLSEATMLFLNLITRKRREGDIPAIADAFVQQFKQQKGITTAVVSSAAMLTDEARQRILDVVQKEVGGTIELVTDIDPELIGGFILRIGDRQLDTSIFSKVEDLRQEFRKNLYVKDY